MHSSGELPAHYELQLLRKFDTIGTIVGILWDEVNGIQKFGDLPGGDNDLRPEGISDDGPTVVGRLPANHASARNPSR
ncbi:MAG: hypothetical protein JRG94_14555 [Deltaproteobacteria bacterium]|nr:hypothetical protein [Deltaproteobacteria bacterium]